VNETIDLAEGVIVQHGGVKLRAFRSEDYKRLAVPRVRELFTDERLQRWALGRPDTGDIFASAGPAVTLLNEGDCPIAALGMLLGREGRAWGWACLSREARSRPLGVHRVMRRLLPLLMEQYGVREVQADEISNWAEGRRWVESFGFKAEGVRVCSETGLERIHYVLRQ
jgi:hypothetical protein